MDISGDIEWLGALSNLLNYEYLEYFDSVKVDEYLSVLEKNPQLTLQKIEHYKYELDKGFNFIFRKRSLGLNERDCDVTKVSDLEYIINEINPEYLRISEHIFGNLLPIIWSLVVSPKTSKKLDLTQMVRELLERNHPLFVEGCDNRIRNSISHGLFEFSGFGINFISNEGDFDLNIEDYLHLFDLLWQSSVSLTLSLLIFMSRHIPFADIHKFHLPINILRLFITPIVNRKAFLLSDAIMTNFVGSGRQPNILINSTYRTPAVFFNECFFIAIKLIHLGVEGTNAFFEIDYGKKTPGLLRIDLNILKDLLASNAPLEEINKAMPIPLIWVNERSFSRKMKIFKDSFSKLLAPNLFDYFIDCYKKNFIFPNFFYHIKNVDESNAAHKGRYSIELVLNFPQSYASKQIIYSIIRNVINRYRNKSMQVIEHDNKLFEKTHLFKPSYIWINIHKSNGTLRWLKNTDIQKRNIICRVEYLANSKLPNLSINNPTEKYKNVSVVFQ